MRDRVRLSHYWPGIRLYSMENLSVAVELEKEDYEVFDNRDLMNVVVHSVLCAGTFKGRVSRDLWPFFALKIWPGPHMNRQKRFCKLFRFCKDIRENACPRSQQLRGHGVCIVNDVIDYADTFWKLWRLLTHFKGKIRQKKVFGCVYTSNRNHLKIWKVP